MNTLKVKQTNKNTLSTGKEEMMSNTSAAVEKYFVATDRNIMSVAGRKEEEKGKHNKAGLALTVLSSILLVVIGIVVLKVTGLYDGLNSTTGKITLCIVISYCYLTAFRRGLFSGKR